MTPAEQKARAKLLMELGFVAIERGPVPAEAPAPEATSRRPAPPVAAAKPAAKRAAPEPPTAHPVSPRGDWAGPFLATREERTEALAAIAAEIAQCTACGLCHSRTLTVPGVGDPMSPLVFIGEGPGAEEDKSGIPFVGRAGQLLTKMIEAMDFDRAEVFILNIVKCRPPGNRTPTPEEMERCLPFLHRQLDIIRPRVIVCLGATAVSGLFPSQATVGITKLRGNWLKFGPADAMPTLHPSYLLRNPAAKKNAWEDLQQVMKVFGKTARRPTGGN